MDNLYTNLIERFGLCFETHKLRLKTSEFNWLWYLYEAYKHNMNGDTFYMIYHKYPPGTTPKSTLSAPDGKALQNCFPIGWAPGFDREIGKTPQPVVTVYFRSRDSGRSIEKPFSEVLKTVYNVTAKYLVIENQELRRPPNIYALLFTKLCAVGKPEFSTTGNFLMEQPGSREGLYESLIKAINDLVISLGESNS